MGSQRRNRRQPTQVSRAKRVSVPCRVRCASRCCRRSGRLASAQMTKERARRALRRSGRIDPSVMARKNSAQKNRSRYRRCGRVPCERPPDRPVEYRFPTSGCLSDVSAIRYQIFRTSGGNSRDAVRFFTPVARVGSARKTGPDPKRSFGANTRRGPEPRHAGPRIASLAA